MRVLTAAAHRPPPPAARRLQRHIGYGTMFGAPLMNDGLVLSRRDYTYAEPTIVYNSGACARFLGGGRCAALRGAVGMPQLAVPTAADA